MAELHQSKPSLFLSTLFAVNLLEFNLQSWGLHFRICLMCVYSSLKHINLFNLQNMLKMLFCVQIALDRPYRLLHTKDNQKDKACLTSWSIKLTHNSPYIKQCRKISCVFCVKMYCQRENKSRVKAAESAVEGWCFFPHVCEDWPTFEM